MKRFYQSAAAGELEGGYGVLLDGRPLRTPAAARLTVPSESLAAALAQEWAAQAERILPASMPMTQIVCTAIDLAASEPERVVEELLGFAEAELLCYRAEEPEELVRRQAALWQPLLDWAAEAYGARFLLARGVVHQAQPPESLVALGQSVARYDPLTLAALAAAVRAAGSLVVGLALTEGRLTPEEAFTVAELDETYNIEQWGEDAQAAARRAAVRADLAAAHSVVTLLRRSRPAAQGSTESASSDV